MIKVKNLTTCIVFLLIFSCLAGCGLFTQQVTPREIVQEERLRLEKNAGFRQGFNEGYKQAQEDMIEYLNENGQALVALRNFQQLITTGGMYAPRVIAVHKPATISSNGQRYHGGSVDLVIQRPAAFANPDVVKDMIGAQNIYVVAFFRDRMKATLAMANLQARLDDTGRRDKAAVIETGDEYALVIKSFSGHDYTRLGFASLEGVPDQAPRDTSQAEEIDLKPDNRYNSKYDPSAISADDAAELERMLEQYRQYNGQDNGQHGRENTDKARENPVITFYKNPAPVSNSAPNSTFGLTPPNIR